MTNEIWIYLPSIHDIHVYSLWQKNVIIYFFHVKNAHNDFYVKPSININFLFLDTRIGIPFKPKSIVVKYSLILFGRGGGEVTWVIKKSKDSYIHSYF